MLALLFLIPMVIMLVFSFWTTNADFDMVPVWNLDNYARFFNQRDVHPDVPQDAGHGRAR